MAKNSIHTDEAKHDPWMQIASGLEGYEQPFDAAEQDAMFSAIEAGMKQREMAAKQHLRLKRTFIITVACAAVLAGVMFLPRVFAPEPQQTTPIAKSTDETEEKETVKSDSIVATPALNNAMKPALKASASPSLIHLNEPATFTDTLTQPNIAIHKEEELIKPTETEPQNPEQPHVWSEDYAYGEDMPLPHISDKGGDKWELALFTHTTLNSALGNPYVADEAPNIYWNGINKAPGLYVTGQRWHSAVPISVGLSFGYKITQRLSVKTGLLYTLMKQHRTIYYNNGIEVEDKFTSHSIGVPLHLSYNWINKGRFELYTSIGGAVSIPLKYTNRLTNENNNIYINPEVYDNKQVLWSIDAAVGLQYNFCKEIGIYAEPGVGYFINTSKRPTIYDDYPFTFILRTGMRLNF